MLCVTNGLLSFSGPIMAPRKLQVLFTSTTGLVTWLAPDNDQGNNNNNNKISLLYCESNVVFSYTIVAGSNTCITYIK